MVWRSSHVIILIPSQKPFPHFFWVTPIFLHSHVPQGKSATFPGPGHEFTMKPSRPWWSFYYFQMVGVDKGICQNSETWVKICWELLGIVFLAALLRHTKQRKYCFCFCHENVMPGAAAAISEAWEELAGKNGSCWRRQCDKMKITWLLDNIFQWHYFWKSSNKREKKNPLLFNTIVLRISFSWGQLILTDILRHLGGICLVTEHFTSHHRSVVLRTIFLTYFDFLKKIKIM